MWKTLLWLSPIVPHVTEFLYQVVIRPVKIPLPVSIHLAVYEKFELPAFSEDVLHISSLTPDVWQVIELVRQARQDHQIKNRYELPAVWLVSIDHKEQSRAFQAWNEVLKKELHVRMIHYTVPDYSLQCTTNATWSCWLETTVNNETKMSWTQADVLRTVQFLRKQAHLALTQQTQVFLECSDRKFLDSLLTPAFLATLHSNAFVTLSPEPDLAWINMKVKGIKPTLLVYLQP